MNVPSHYQGFHRGIWGILDNSLPAKACAALPSTADRYFESVHFAELAVAVPPTQAGFNRVNWYTSAHVAAYIGIFEAAKYDIKNLDTTANFKDTPLAKELRASSWNADLIYKDPVNASQLYRALRNLRVHFAQPIVELDVRQIVSDAPNWYVRLIEPATYRLLNHAPLKDEELRKYNEYLQKETIIDVFGRMLAINRENIIETANVVAAQP
jgi:hypothetical protein